MKKSIGVFLAVTLFCLSVAGCSAPSPGQSSLSGPDSQSTSGSVSAPSSASSASQSSASLQSSKPANSTASQSSQPSEQEEEWVSPTGMEPYTSKALYEYYEGKPELKEYYYDYLVPAPLVGSIWSDENDFPTYSFVIWLYQNMSEEERSQHVKQADLYNNGTAYPVMDADFVEKSVSALFDLDGEKLRKVPDAQYSTEYQAYEVGWLGIGERMVNVITDAIKTSEEITLTVYRVYSQNFEQGNYTQQLDEYENCFQMHIYPQKDGSVKYGPSTKP